jgi:hypothetical protein
MATPIFKAKIIQGEIRLERNRDFKSHLQGLEGKDVEVIVRRWRKKRSLPQNSYYWGVVLKLIAGQTGHTDEEVHEHMKWRFLRKHGKLETVRSTTKLSTIEMEEYLAKIRNFAQEKLDIYIPLPNEISDEDMGALNNMEFEN